jgi:hypothetical protein
MTDKAYFHLSGYIKKQNFVLLEKNTPPVQPVVKSWLWCAVAFFGVKKGIAITYIKSLHWDITWFAGASVRMVQPWPPNFSLVQCG